MKDQRFVKAEFAVWVGIVGNVLLALMKGIIGLMANSKALIADAAHSASDVAGSIAVLVGLRAAQLPPDEDRPYGHAKAESIAAIIVSVILLFVGVEIGINAIKAISHGVQEAPAGYALIAIIISIAVKEAMFQYKYRLGKKLSSQVLIANAGEHRSDVYSSIAAFFGVGAAVAGVFLDQPWLYYMDPAAGILVALFIIKMGYSLVMVSIHGRMDHVFRQEDAKELVKAVQCVKGVVAIESLRAREHGHYVVVDIKISVNPKISVVEAQDVGRAVKFLLMDRFSHVSDVLIHIHPYDPGYLYKITEDPEQEEHPTLLH